MAYTPLKISIPEPCHEDWDGMHPVSGTTARHCGSCAKNVVDFTGFTDVQMHDYVRLNGNKMCGRFRPDQLGRPLRAVPRPASNPLKVAATAAGLMLAASGCNTLDQVKNTAYEPLEVVELVEGLPTSVPVTGGISIEEVEQSKVCPPPANHMVVGRIGTSYSPTVPPLPPPIYEVGEITAKEFELAGDIVVEDVDTIDEILVVPSPLPDTNLTIDSIPDTMSIVGQDVSHQMIMGLMVMHEPEPYGLDWVKDTLRKAITPPSSAPESTTSHPRPRPNELPPHLENMTVYPNPFVSELVVAIDLPHAQTVVVELVGPNGRRVHVESFEGIEGSNNFVIVPKRRKLVHAAYHLRVTDLLGRVATRTVVR